MSREHGFPSKADADRLRHKIEQRAMTAKVPEDALLWDAAQMIQVLSDKLATPDAVEATAREPDLWEIVADEAWTVRAVDEYDSLAGDGDVRWDVIQYHMAEPRERVIGTGRTPKAAVQNAVRNTAAPVAAEQAGPTPEVSRREMRAYYGHGTACHAHEDGECFWSECPQIRDNEPTATGRHCPLDISEQSGEDRPDTTLLEGEE